MSKDYFDETNVMGSEQDLKVAVALYSPFENPIAVQLLDPTFIRLNPIRKVRVVSSHRQTDLSNLNLLS